MADRNASSRFNSLAPSSVEHSEYATFAAAIASRNRFLPLISFLSLRYRSTPDPAAAASSSHCALVNSTSTPSFR
jgi:hypothetical protein